MEQALALIAERAAKGGGKKKKKKRRRRKPKVRQRPRSRSESLPRNRSKESRTAKKKAAAKAKKKPEPGGRRIIGQRRAANAPAARQGAPACTAGRNPGATKRDLARLTGLKGSDRILLKRMLHELEGRRRHLKASAKRGLTKAGELPEVAVLEITGTDSDGELLARPSELGLQRRAAAPSMSCRQRKAPHWAPATAFWRGWKSAAKATKPASSAGWNAKRAPNACSACCARAAHGFRVMPVDTQDARRICAGQTRPARREEQRTGAGRTHRPHAPPVSQGAGGRAHRQHGSPRTISLIAIHAHGIPTEFPQSVLDEAKAAKPVRPAGRTDLRAIPLVTIDPRRCPRP